MMRLVMAKINGKLTSLLSDGVVIGDGAMGSMLYQYGVFINTCFDELNLTSPDLIKKIHNSYIEAGSDFIETNTFGANEYKLAKFGLADKAAEINIAAVNIARSCAGKDVLVAGSIGPIGCQFAEHSRISDSEALRIFSDQANILATTGVDFLFLETFSNVAELLIAIDAAAATGLEIVAQMSVTENGKTIYGLKVDEAISRIASHTAVTAVGLNCAIGPLAMLNSLKEIRKVTDKPISAQPNAGRPQEVEGRMIYMCTPEYMAEYAKRFYENGVRIIGGCCGTNPEHIKQIAGAVRPMDKAGKPVPSISVTVAEPVKAVGFEPVRLAERSKLGKKLASEEPITCIELLPPKGADMSALIDKIKLCADHGIDAINIPDGPRASSRLSPMVTAIKTQQVADIETILHVCCRDRNIISMQSDMLGAQAMGLKNVLLITGDPPKLGEYPDATAVFDLDSIALTAVVHNLNRGLDIAGNQLPAPLSLTIGVGANPVASDLHREIDRFKQKAAAGAEYAITQPVFDTEMFYTFQAVVAECKVPLVAGIWPFTSYKNAEFMANEVPGVVVPKRLLERMSAAKTREQGRRLGVEIAREMVEHLNDHIAGFAVSAPFGNVKIALAALGKIGIEEI